jgi:hypothetical protein
MANFIKALSASLVLCVSVFAQGIDLNARPQENQQVSLVNAQEQYERFTRMRKWGTGLIIGGATVGMTGIIMSSVNLVKADDYTGWYIAGSPEHRHAQEQIDKYEGRALAWLLVGTLGNAAMTAGIPIRIVGRVRANHYRNMLPNSAYIVPNGARFAWNF